MTDITQAYEIYLLFIKDKETLKVFYELTAMFFLPFYEQLSVSVKVDSPFFPTFLCVE